MIFKKVRVKKNGLMEPDTLDNTQVVSSMDLVLIHGQMKARMKEIGRTIKFLAMVSIHGRMVDRMMATGKIII